MSIRVFVVICGLMAGAVQGVAAGTAFEAGQERTLSSQEQQALMASPAYDVLKVSARVILQAVACGDRQMAAKAQAIVEATLAAQGARPTRSMVAAAEASFASDPDARAELSADCTASMQDAAGTLAELSQN